MSVQDHLQPGEEILYRARITRLTQAPLVALVAVILAFTIFAWFGLKNGTVAMIVGLLAVILGLMLAWRLFRLSTYELVVTNHRVILQTGILGKRSMDTRLDKINNIEHRQSLWGRLLNYGDVEIDTASETGISRFSNIANPLELKRTIMVAAEQYRSGGSFGAGPAQIAAGPSGAERLRQLKSLLDDNLISREEFEAKRRELLPA
ncbi:MAG TPA: PH domain-containing protein [Thermoanaerobaculia bacterium]|nr:PH domain-containing protein [Thermoanaerobaculia bacterium]